MRKSILRTNTKKTMMEVLELMSYIATGSLTGLQKETLLLRGLGTQAWNQNNIDVGRWWQFN